MSSIYDFSLDKFLIYPADSQKKRKKLISNETPHEQNNIYHEVADPKATPRKKARFAKDRIEFSLPKVQEHVASKVYRIVREICDTFNTKFQSIEIGNTHLQGRSAKTITVHHEGGIYRQRLQAVHSGCIPTLIVKKDPDSKPYILNAFSSSENHQSTCADLPDFVNQADSTFEGGKKNNGLRQKLVPILVKGALKSISLVGAAQASLAEYETIIQTKLAELEDGDTRKRVWGVFLESVQHHKSIINLRYIEGVLDLIPPPTVEELPTEELRNAVCELKCGLIQRRAGLESNFHHEGMSPARRAALGRRRRSPHNFPLGLRQYLLENSALAPKARRFLLNQFNLSEEQIRATGDCDKAYQFVKEKKPDLTNFQHVVETISNDLERLNNAYRIDLIKIFMEHKHLSFDQVFNAYCEIEEIDYETFQELFVGAIPLSTRNIEILACVLEVNVWYFEMAS